MFAIIRTGGKQYKVKSGDTLSVEKLDNYGIGEQVVFDTVLLIGDDKKTVMGKDLQKAKVAGVVVNQERSDKVIIFKKVRRHTYRRKKGHRQHQTVVRIQEISLDGNISAKSDAPKTSAKVSDVNAAKPTAVNKKVESKSSSESKKPVKAPEKKAGSSQKEKK